MTHLQRVEEWHRVKPTWASGFSAQDWGTAEEIARRFDMLEEAAPESCAIEVIGSPGYCRLQAGHDGPCDVVYD